MKYILHYKNEYGLDCYLNENEMKQNGLGIHTEKEKAQTYPSYWEAESGLLRMWDNLCGVKAQHLFIIKNGAKVCKFGKITVQEVL